MWKNRNVWIILAGEAIAGLGLWTGIIGNLEFMQEHIPSDFVKSLIMFAGLLAGVAVGPMAGRIIDSSKKKTILLYSGFGRLFSVVFMLLALKFESIWWMVMFMVAIQLSAAFYFPALQALIPMVVRDKDLLTMNGVHMNVATVARIAGTAMAGAMMVVMSLYSLYISSIIAYALLLFSTMLLKVEEDESSAAVNNGKKQPGSFKEVIPVLRGVPIAMMGLLLTIVPTLFVGGFNLMVINISELQDSDTIKGLLYTVEGLSFMAGAFLVKRVSQNKNPLVLMFFFATIIGFAHLSLYFADIRIMSLISFGIFGFGLGCFFPIVSTIFQTKIPREYHGRFFSFRNMFDRVMFQIVLLSTGLFLDTIGLQNMVLVFGTISLLLVAYYAMKNMKSPIPLHEQLPSKQHQA